VWTLLHIHEGESPPSLRRRDDCWIATTASCRSFGEKRRQLSNLVYQLEQLKIRAMERFIRRNKEKLSRSNMEGKKGEGGAQKMVQTDLNKLLLPLKLAHPPSICMIGAS